MTASEQVDVAIVGGGPSGSTAALVLARAGLDVVIIEKQQFPRFQIGESFLPATFDLMNDLGLADRLERAPHTRKYGIEFAFGDQEESSRFEFSWAYGGGKQRAFNIARADFDQLLLDAALEAGAELRMPVSVTGIEHLDDGDVRLATDDTPVRARYLLDATGQGTLVARHLGTRRISDEPFLRKVALFEHFTGAYRAPGELAGNPSFALCDEGWFWSIPLNETTTSIGLVMDAAAARQADVPMNRLLAWGIDRCPFFKRRMADATGPDHNRVRSDFSYTCHPYSGPGYYLLGDAASFFDPVFSTGVFLSMESAVKAGRQIRDILGGTLRPEAARRDYDRMIRHVTSIYLNIIGHFYTHEFRELFLEGQGPFKMERAVMTVLAGHVLPKIPFAARWRNLLFEICIAMQRRRALAPRRKTFSLLSSEPDRVSNPTSPPLPMSTAV